MSQPSRPHKKSFGPTTILGILGVIALVAVGIVGTRLLTSPQPKTVKAEWQTSVAVNDVPADKLADANVTVEQKSAATDDKDADASKKKEAAKEVKPATIEVMMIGDVLMHDELVNSGNLGNGSYDFGFLFEHIQSYIDEADLRILNQETVMGEPELGYGYRPGAVGPIFNTPTALADTEVDIGFNAILKAANHVYDVGYSGLAHELDYWRQTYPQIPILGVDNPGSNNDGSQDLVHNVYVYEHDGMKVGILNYTWATNENPNPDTDADFVSYLSEEKIHDDVTKAREAGAEMIIACPHWGREYTTETSEEENRYAKIFCDEGVDVIFGAHPHILQPVELLQNEDGHKMVCFYSTGNFVAAGGMETNSLIGGIARCTLERKKDGTYQVSAASLVPTVICYTVGPNMSAWPISEWTNELAAQSYRSNCTPAYATTFCQEVLGEGYDAEAGVFTLDVSGEGIPV
ncbi:MAG: CapA family protein [Coriobacteriales bacterium]|nr:CapA family protein [Coriobacteriales bacterium]